MGALSRFYWGIVVATVLGGCGFEAAVPQGRTITCSATSGCPAGYTCRPSIGRCVDQTQLNAPAPSLSNGSITPEIGNLTTVFTVAFSVSSALEQAPTAYATAFGTSVETYPLTCAACSPTAPCTCTFAPRTLSTPPAEGPLHVWVELVDTLGNAPPPFEVGALQIDLTAPGISNPAELTLFGPPGATTPITELGASGSAQVCFTATETLGATPPVWASAAGDAGVIGFSLEDGGFPLGLRYCYVGALVGATVDGPRTIWAALTDLAGNQATVDLVDADGGLVVDTTPPPGPDTSPDAGLIYRRAPWGELSELGTPSFSLRSLGAAIGKAGTLVVYADPAGQSQIAQGPVSAGVLSPPLSFPGPDRAAIYVDLVDGAGNRLTGGPVEVLNEEWVATLGNKVAGDELANPNDCYAREVLEPLLIQGDDAVTALSAPSGPDAGTLLIPGAGTWRSRAVSGPDEPDSFPPPGALPTAAAYDPAHGQVLLIVAQGDLNVPLETWLYDGDWHQRFPVGAQPGYREGTALAYDTAAGRAVLFGGTSAAPFGAFAMCDTWEWDGTVWRSINTCLGYPDGGASDPTQPPPRISPALAYDRVRHQTVLFGGQTAGGALLGDSWQLSGSTWSPLDVSQAPTPRAGASMAFAALGDGGSALVMVGGSVTADGGGSNETWFGVWDGATYAWTQAAGSASCTTGPDCAVALLADQTDSTASPVLATFDGQLTVHLWRWNGSDAWDPAGEVESGALYAFDATPGSLGGNAYLVGGLSVATQNFQDFVCDAKLDCSPGHVANGDPVPPLTVASLGFDNQGDGLLFGGTDLSGNVYNGAYLWNGFDWTTFVANDGGGPTPRLQPAIAFNPEENRFWLVAGNGVPEGDPTGFGSLSDGWALDLDGGGWAPLGNAFLCPNSSASLVYVPDGGGWSGMVLGNVQVETQQDTARMVPVPDGGVVAIDLGPIAAYGAVLVYDQERGRLDAMADGNGEILQFDVGCDGGWCLAQTGAPLVLPYAAYDTAGQRPLFIGEYRSDPLAGDLYSYTGGPLAQVLVADPEGDGAPTDLGSLEAVAYDPLRGGLLSYGGELDLENASGATWDFTQAPHRPGLACAFRFSHADPPEGAVVESVAVQALGGADPDGAELEVWEGGRWAPVAVCGGACPSTAPSSLAFATTDPVELGLVLSDLETVGAAVTSVAANGSGQALVSAGAVEVTVGYRLP